MQIRTATALCAVFFAAPLILAQAPPAATMAPPASRPATSGASSSAQVGRNELYKYLDDIAAKDEVARRADIAKIVTRAQAEARQRVVRAKLMQLLGGSFGPNTPLNPRITGSTQLDGFRIEKVLFDSQPNFPVTALLYLPDTPKTPSATASGVGSHKLPAIVMSPGHGPTGKASDSSMASTFARNGFAVLSYDPIGQGERLQYPDPEHSDQTLAHQSTGEHAEAGLQPTLIGDAVARYFIWDGMRAVDYLLSRPEIDPASIGAFGCSGGGDMTAMIGALDSRIHATATACYLTSFDALMPSIGPQDAEQSIPGFIAAGFDFPDWVEITAPRPYAMVGTVSDMFPWAGFLTTATEARRFYSLFNPAAEGTPTGSPLPPTPTGPTLNPDTSNTIAPNAPFQLITGIGGHGNLGPITSQIVSFFLVNLAHSTAAPIVPAAGPRGGGGASSVPAAALQVTPTGQVLTSYPGAATVHTLNLKRAAEKIHPPAHPQTILQLQTDIREVTYAATPPGRSIPEHVEGNSVTASGMTELKLTTDPGITLNAELYQPSTPGKHAALLVLRDDIDPALDSQRADDIHRLSAEAQAGTTILAINPRPSPPGTESTKAPILGPFYMSELRAEVTGNTLLGMRVDDIIRAVDYLASRSDVDPNKITAEASGHMGLVLLHAAVLDPRLKHITIDHTLESYRSLIDAPMPLDAPQDILPGVMLKYDIPDLIRVLGPRLTFNSPLPGTANLAAPSPAASGHS